MVSWYDSEHVSTCACGSAWAADKHEVDKQQGMHEVDGSMKRMGSKISMQVRTDVSAGVQSPLSRVVNTAYIRAINAVLLHQQTQYPQGIYCTAQKCCSTHL